MVPAPLFFVLGAISQYVGAALAVGLFDELSPAAVAWLRVGFSAAALWLGLRLRPGRGPHRRPSGRTRPAWSTWDQELRRSVVVFGAALAGMNLCFYLAIARLPLGTAVAIEFTGPIAVAAFGARRRRNLAAVGLAAAGVLLLADVQWQASASGVVAALGAATLWAVYILAGGRVAARVSGLEGLTWALVVGTLVIAPFGVAGVVAGQPSVAVVAGCALVALLSSVVPYSLDQLVLPRLTPGRFALLLSLLPVTATVLGALLLGQHPSGAEVAGIGLVIAALLLRARG
jgi:inner membrane transporter RhtA